MFKLLNKKGQAASIPFIFWGVATILCSTAFLPGNLKTFRERKGVEFCMERENLTLGDCQSAIHTMPKNELLAYIKDDNVSKKSIMNFGNLN